MDDVIRRQTAIDSMTNTLLHYPSECYRNLNKYEFAKGLAEFGLKSVPPAQPEIIHCRECKHWMQQTNYAGAPLSFGFCESDDMWRSLYGEICEVSHIDTDDDFYCGYAERREE